MSIEGRKIVVIDDTPSIRTFLRVSLEYEGAEFIGAASATTGLNLCQSENPDMVILDLGLPDMDGLDVLPKIKETQPGKKLPVLVLTVRKGRETIEKAYEKGADGYLTKPFVIDDLIDLIEEKVGHAA